MDNFRNAAKAFIVHDEKLLLLKRRPNDVHKPGEWDIPGGRLDPGENPFTGLERETKEETELENHLKSELLKDELKTLSVSLAGAETSKDNEEVEVLMKKINKLHKEILVLEEAKKVL